MAFCQAVLYMHTISMADEMLCFKPSLRRRIAVAAARANSLRCCGFSRFFDKADKRRFLL
jgi:hypothetical protein